MFSLSACCILLTMFSLSVFMTQHLNSCAKCCLNLILITSFLAFHPTLIHVSAQSVGANLQMNAGVWTSRGKTFLPPGMWTAGWLQHRLFYVILHCSNFKHEKHIQEVDLNWKTCGFILYKTLSQSSVYNNYKKWTDTCKILIRFMPSLWLGHCKTFMSVFLLVTMTWTCELTKKLKSSVGMKGAALGSV